MPPKKILPAQPNTAEIHQYHIILPVSTASKNTYNYCKIPYSG